MSGYFLDMIQFVQTLLRNLKSHETRGGIEIESLFVLPLLQWNIEGDDRTVL